MNDKKIDLENFNFNAFQQEAIQKLKSGESLIGKGGALTPLIKQIITAVFKGKMEAHLSD